MASHGGLTLAQEAVGTCRECASTNSGRRAIMLVTTGLWLVATGIVALSLESFGAALVLFGIAGWLLS
jgi:hypothetical protein